MRWPSGGRRTMLILLGLVVSGVCLWAALRQASWSEVRASVEAASWAWIIPSLALTYLTLLVRAIRWRYLFLEPERVSVWESAKAINVGLLFGNLLPSRAGEVPRIFALGARTGVSKVETGGTIVVERAFDLLTVAIAALLLWPVLPSDAWVQALVGICAVVVACLVVGSVVLWILRGRAAALSEAGLRRLPFITDQRAASFTTSFARGVRVVADPRRFIVVLSLSVLVWIVTTASVYALFPALDLPLSWASAWLVVVATSLALTVPATSAGLGVYEAAVQASLVAFGVPASEALAFALVLHAINIVPISITGAVAAWSTLAGARTADHDEHVRGP